MALAHWPSVARWMPGDRRARREEKRGRVHLDKEALLPKRRNKPSAGDLRLARPPDPRPRSTRRSSTTGSLTRSPVKMCGAVPSRSAPPSPTPHPRRPVRLASASPPFGNRQKVHAPQPRFPKQPTDQPNRPNTPNPTQPTKPHNSSSNNNNEHTKMQPRGPPAPTSPSHHISALCSPQRVIV